MYCRSQALPSIAGTPQMCCEQVKCYVAVYDHTESVCYLKGVGATHSNDYKAMNGFTSYDMLFRGGAVLHYSSQKHYIITTCWMHTCCETLYNLSSTVTTSSDYFHD